MTMSPETLEEKVAYLLDRQEILDVVTVYARAVDRLDEECLFRAYHEDALDDHGSFAGTVQEFRDWAFGLHRRFHESSQHLVANHLAEIDGETAHAETYWLASVVNRTGAPTSTVGGRYLDRLEKRDGRWGIAARKSVVDWTLPSVNTREAVETGDGLTNMTYRGARETAAMDTREGPTRDGDDPSYARPMVISEARINAFREHS